MLKIIMTVFGFFTSLFSFIFCCAAIYDLFHPEQTDTGTGILAGLLIFFSMTALGGGYLFVSGIRKSRRHRFESVEKQLLKLIEENKGRITPEEVAVESSLTLTEAKKHLNRMCVDGSGELQMTRGGSPVYVFYGFIPDAEKETASSLLD